MRFSEVLHAGTFFFFEGIIFSKIRIIRLVIYTSMPLLPARSRSGIADHGLHNDGPNLEYVGADGRQIYVLQTLY